MTTEVVRPSIWNVVVLGRWNRGILTPRGIATRVFKLDDASSLEVDVPVDGLAPYRVRVGETTVSVDQSTLNIGAEIPNYETLNRARELACRALEALPETPFVASGYNVRFSSSDPLPGLAGATECSLDSALADADYELKDRWIHRSVPFKSGAINIKIQQENNSTGIEFNFHRASDRMADHLDWLRVPIQDVQGEVEKMLETLGLSYELASE